MTGQRLLWAYPRAYRRAHGDEIVTTLLDMADDGRLGRAQKLHLVVCGLRQRFRLPARRPLAWAGAILAALTLGAFGAVSGTWLGWQTAASVPSDHDLRALNVALTGMPGAAAVYREPSAMKGPNALVRADGTSTFSAVRIRNALTSAGWQITSFSQEPGSTITDLTARSESQIPATFVFYTAAKGDLKLDGQGDVITGGASLGLAGQSNYSTEVWPREAPAVRPLTVAGFVLGALAGWLLAAVVAYRVRRRRLATGLLLLGFAAVALPVYAHYRDAYQVLVYAHGSPYPYIVYSPGDQPRTMPYTLLALFALAAALVAARPNRQPATAVA